MSNRSIVDKAIHWNEQRYEQEFDYGLAIQLLIEETKELYEAKNDVAKLDAIGDITFVAIGCLWKLGFSKQQIYDIFYVHNMAEMSLEEALHWMMNIQAISFDILDHDIEGAWPGLVFTLYSVFVTALGSLQGMGNQNIFYDVVHAICDSNATKSIGEKTPSNVKANIDKGSNYVPPTAKLLELYTISLNTKKRLN